MRKSQIFSIMLYCFRITCLFKSCFIWRVFKLDRGGAFFFTHPFRSSSFANKVTLSIPSNVMAKDIILYLYFSQRVIAASPLADPFRKAGSVNFNFIEILLWTRVLTAKTADHISFLSTNLRLI